MAEAQKWEDLAVDWLLLAPRILVVHYEELVANHQQQLARQKQLLI